MIGGDRFASGVGVFCWCLVFDDLVGLFGWLLCVEFDGARCGLCAKGRSR